MSCRVIFRRIFVAPYHENAEPEQTGVDQINTTFTEQISLSISKLVHYLIFPVYKANKGASHMVTAADVEPLDMENEMFSSVFSLWCKKRFKTCNFRAGEEISICPTPTFNTEASV